jgi:serine protease Do
MSRWAVSPRDERRMAAMLAMLAGAVGAALSAGCSAPLPDDYFEAPPVRPAPVPPSEAAPPEVAVVPPDTQAPPEESAPARPVVPTPSPEAVATTGAPPEGVLPSFADLFRRLSPSVVNIYTQEVVSRRLVDPWSGRLRELPEVGTSLGSGFVVDPDGYILTNAHVVENAAEIRVRFQGGDEMPARLVGIDPVRDLALLKVDGAAGLVSVTPGDSDAAEVGDWVIAIGNPFGLSHTLTKGIISATGRAEVLGPDTGYSDLIQTDVPLNRGSSGGPLFNLRGEVVGINTAVSTEGHGIAFAIPWNVVADALPRLEKGGRVSRSWLGVYVRAVGAPSREEGLLVEGVVDDSPASRAGLRPGDVLLALDGREVGTAAEFRMLVASGVTGRSITVVLRRGKERLELPIALAEARDP